MNRIQRKGRKPRSGDRELAISLANGGMEPIAIQNRFEDMGRRVPHLVTIYGWIGGKRSRNKRK